VKVQCTKIDKPAVAETSTWLTVGRIYDVLEVYAYPGGPVELRIESDDQKTPALFDSSCFVTVDETIAESWVASVGESGTFLLGPKEWSLPGFWESFFDGNDEALKSFALGRSVSHVERLSDLTERETFGAMSLFLNRFVERAGDDLLTLLGDLSLMPDGGPVDPAAWEDWQSCVRAVRSSDSD
jgi:hypothetical protein